MATGSKGDDQEDTEDKMLEVGAVLLKDFIYERVKMTRWEGDDMTVTRADLCGGEQREVLCDPDHKKLARCLQQIYDELDRNQELQRMINDSSLSPTRDVFMAVAREIFSDGKFSWGRVVALFYLACRLVIKALVAQTPDFIKTIICWVLDYLRENVISWIREQGGWEGIRSHFGTPTWQTAAVLLVGVLTTVIVIHRV